MPKLESKSIEWAIDSILSTGDTYLFPIPFELKAIAHFKAEVISHIRKIDLGNMKFGSYRTSIAPKSIKGFRIATQLDPIDSILTLAIIKEISSEIESQRVNTNKNCVYSFRLKPDSDGSIYDKQFRFSKFKFDIKTELANPAIKFVFVTDISDFYPSIYMHDIETSLFDLLGKTPKKMHANALISICNVMHANQTHKGVPVGPQFSRPIAELVMDAVDKHLLEKGINFKRYVDDYVFFCKTEHEAYKMHSMFAQILFEMRGLKLNESKTFILPKSGYISKVLFNPATKARFRQIIQLEKLLEEAGVDVESYDEIDFEKLDPEIQEKIQKLNFKKMLEDELKLPNPDSSMTAFIINNLARLDDTGITDVLLSKSSIEKLNFKLKGVINYFKFIRSYSEPQKHHIGKEVIATLKTSYISEVAFNRMWLLDLFSESNEWDNQDEFQSMYDTYSDDVTRRKVILALKNSKNVAFFRANKHTSLDSMNPWTKRAFIFGMSCLPDEEKRPWFKARIPMEKNFTEEIVEKWSKL